MRRLKVVLVTVLPLFVLLLGVFLLQGGVEAAPERQVSPAAVPGWPPVTRNLSSSGDKDSGSGSIEANDQVVVAVWLEGLDKENSEGSVKMAWQLKGESWQSRVFPPPTEFQYLDPDFALVGNEAHIVWVKVDDPRPDYPEKKPTQVQYTRCTLSAVSSSCGVTGEQVSADDPPGKQYIRSGPAIDVDSTGTPHVVWAETDDAGRPYIQYARRDGGQPWSGGPEPLSIVGDREESPAIAIAGDSVYVAWQETSLESLSHPNRRGSIRLRRRDGIGASAVWNPDLADPAVELSKLEDVSVPNPDPNPMREWNGVYFDSRPTMDAVEVGGEPLVYVMWQRRLGVKEWLVGEGTEQIPVHRYSLAYKVLTGTQVTTDWWPSYLRDTWATVDLSAFYTPTSVEDGSEWYSGIRPSFTFVGQEPHVVFHRSIPEGTGFRYEVEYWAGEAGDYAYWAYKTNDIAGLTVNPIPPDRRFFALPDIAIVQEDEPYLYTLVHQRTGNEQAFDAWYLSKEETFWTYLPSALKKH